MKPVMTVDVAQFARDIDEVKRESGRSSEEMLKYVMVMMLKTGHAATKLGRKNRSLVYRENEPDRDADDSETEGKGARFFRVFRQGSFVPRRVFVPTIPRKSKNNDAARAEAIRARDAIVAKFRRIHFQGIAKASWNWAIGMVQGAKISMEGARKGRRELAEMVKSLSGNHPYIEVTNKLEWIRKIAPDIEPKMMASADAQLQRWLEKRWQTGIDRAERRAA